MTARTRSLLIVAAFLGAAVVASLAGAVTGQPSQPPPGESREDRLAAQLVREREATATLQARLRARVRTLAADLRVERRLTRLVRNPSPANNRELARRLFTSSEFAALDRIAAGGDGIGGAPGESDWRHLVWNGGHEGAWPDRTRSQGSGACLVGNAYGIGQACPRQKMEAWAGTTAVYEIPALQLHWMEHYARGRYGSLEAAGAHWNMSRSW